MCQIILTSWSGHPRGHHCKQITVLGLVYGTNSTRIVDAQPQRKLEGVYFWILRSVQNR